jgi:hypothetical protein
MDWRWHKMASVDCVGKAFTGTRATYAYATPMADFCH